MGPFSVDSVCSVCIIIKGRSYLGISKAIVKTGVVRLSWWRNHFCDFFANWKLTAGCQIVLRRGNAGTVILWLNDSEVSCWKRQKNGCLTRWWCHWSLTSTWPYVSASVCTFQVWQCHQETIDITLLDFLAFICIKKTGGSIDTTTSCVRFSQSSCLYYISNNEFKPVNQHGDSPLCICHIAALCEKLTCHFLFFFCFPAKSFKLNTKCVNVIPPPHTHTHWKCTPSKQQDTKKKKKEVITMYKYKTSGCMFSVKKITQLQQKETH